MRYLNTDLDFYTPGTPLPVLETATTHFATRAETLHTRITEAWFRIPALLVTTGGLFGGATNLLVQQTVFANEAAKTGLLMGGVAMFLSPLFIFSHKNNLEKEATASHETATHLKDLLNGLRQEHSMTGHFVSNPHYGGKQRKAFYYIEEPEHADRYQDNFHYNKEFRPILQRAYNLDQRERWLKFGRNIGSITALGGAIEALWPQGASGITALAAGIGGSIACQVPILSVRKKLRATALDYFAVAKHATSIHRPGIAANFWYGWNAIGVFARRPGAWLDKVWRTPVEDIWFSKAELTAARGELVQPIAPPLVEPTPAPQPSAIASPAQAAVSDKPVMAETADVKPVAEVPALLKPAAKPIVIAAAKPHHDSIMNRRVAVAGLFAVMAAGIVIAVASRPSQEQAKTQAQRSVSNRL